MRQLDFVRFGLAGLGLFLSGLAISYAQGPGIARSTSPIRVLAPMAITGPMAATSAEYLAGAEAHIQEVNAANGIRGKKIELIQADNPHLDKAQEALTHLFAANPNAVAMFMPMQITSTLELINSQKIPVIAPPNGGFEEHDPDLAPNSFHFKGSWEVQFAKVAEHISTININRVAFVYDSIIGSRESSSLALITQMFLRHKINIKPVYLKDDPHDLDAAISELVSFKPQAVVLGLLGDDMIKFLSAYKLRHEKWPLYSTSQGNQKSIREAVKLSGATIGITQELPPFWDRSFPIVRAYQEAMKKQSKLEFSYHSLEGYIAARVLTEALRKATPNITRTSMIIALESLSRVDLGGFIVSFSPTRHTSASYIDLTLLKPDGRYIR